MTIERNGTTVERPPGYMAAIPDLELALAQACALASRLQRNDRPDDVELQAMHERWVRALIHERRLRRQRRREVGGVA